MNVLGRILVFLNLLFALVVGGFLLIVTQTQMNWKNAYKELKREMDAGVANSSVQTTKVKDYADAATKLEQQLTEEQKLREKEKKDYDQKVLALNSQHLKAQQAAKDAMLSAKQYQGEIERLNKENSVLNKNLSDRDDKILTLQKEKDKYYKEMTQAFGDRDLALARVEQMEKQNQTMALEIAKLEAIKIDGSGTKFKNGLTPPPFFIKGIIEKVNAKDSTLVQISLGSDHGMKSGYVLEAYRTEPSAKYLGKVEIVEVFAHKSVGKLLTSKYTPPVSLKSGDEVASKIIPGY